MTEPPTVCAFHAKHCLNYYTSTNSAYNHLCIVIYSYMTKEKYFPASPLGTVKVLEAKAYLYQTSVSKANCCSSIDID